MINKFSPIEIALAKIKGGTLLDAKTYPDKVVIVLVEGPKYTFTKEEAEELLDKAERDAKAKAKAKAQTEKAAKQAEKTAKDADPKG